MDTNFNKDLIICRKCKNDVVWSDYTTKCVICQQDNWGYPDSELNKAKRAKFDAPVDIPIIVCKVCSRSNEINAHGLKCQFCNTNKWGYNDFELQYNLVNQEELRAVRQNQSEIDSHLQEDFSNEFISTKNGAVITPEVVAEDRKNNTFQNNTFSYVSPIIHEMKTAVARPDGKYILKVVSYGLLSGLLIVFLLTYYTYNNYENAIYRSKVFATTFKNDPVLNYNFETSDHINSKEFNWRLLVNMGVLDWKSDPDNDLSGPLDTALTSAFQRRDLSTSTNLEILDEMLQALGSPTDNPNSKDKMEADRELIIARCLAGGPDAQEYLRNYDNPQKNASKRLDFLKLLEPVSAWEDKVSVQEILSQLIANSKAAANYADNVNKSGAKLDRKDEYVQLVDFLMRFVISINDDPDVVRAKNMFTILVGTTQYYMYLVFGIGILILIRNFQILRSKDDNYLLKNEGNRRFSIVLFDWIYIALPSLGFIGTKLGLSEALSGADSIVRASNGVNQSLAISDVSSKMGVAFTSTLVGLVLLMILMIMNLILKYINLKWDNIEN